MNNLVQAIKMALRYRYSIGASLICSVMVAILWGANITAVYPFVDVIFKDQTLHEWIDLETEKLVDEKTVQDVLVAKLQTELTTSPHDRVLSRRLEFESEKSSLLSKQLTGKEKLRATIYQYAPTSPFMTLIYLVGFVVTGTLIKCIFRAMSTVLVARVGHKTAADIRNEFFRSRLADDASRFQNPVGDTAGRISGDVGAIGQALQTLFGRTVQEPLKMFACLLGAAYINWRLLVLTLLAFPMAAFLLLGLAKSIRRASHRSFDQTCMLISRMMQTFRGMEIVKAYNMESHERRQFWEFTNRLYIERVKIAFFESLVRANNELLGVGMLGLSVLAGGHLVLNKTTSIFGVTLADSVMTPGLIMTFFGFLIGCTDPLRKLSDIFGNIQSGVAACDRLIPLIDQADAARAAAGSKARIKSAADDIVFENVCFHYNPGQPVLRDISFRIKQGETLALVGPNGCGKSTLVKLLLKFLEPTGGSIKIGDANIADIRPKDLRRCMALVTQQPVLFSSSVAENIAYGTRGATREQIIEAAEKAYAHEFIMSALSNGYETSCGEFGGRLSGGQQQRIALARAIMRDPDILLLDEAASQIDPKSETLICESLGEFAKNRTTIMITHRMSTLSLADRILVLEAGKIADIGTHDELIERCGRYRHLYQKNNRKAA